MSIIQQQQICSEVKSPRLRSDEVFKCSYIINCVSSGVNSHMDGFTASVSLLK